MKGILLKAFLLVLCLTGLSFASIHIKSKEIELGQLIQGKPIDCVFYLENTGDKPVHLKKVVPD
jgi:hypothetical protein